MKKDRNYCCVADALCLAPAGYKTESGIADGVHSARCRCHSCGEPVCQNCSDVRSVPRKGKRRICNNCLIEMDGGDYKVMARLHILANGGK